LRDDDPPADERYRALTPLQRQILRANQRGLSLEQMSARFCRSAFTLRRQFAHICARFGARDRRELRVKVRHCGIG
jgi:DNA-binding NarL/FixJ family response regulator